ncbi:hypothetical protein L207DRAFT_441988 [Hyaloscypha variabilis F]|uniref:G domain-containing protein n=1 Tax=Hyaloscypha variabilis (strain UAMH 11265 / GT02V1 / F) TaxID=1149755 RepID=A0A2J6QYV8_HYAVF|nr:hypothetical protein L207DRAFT_441988 [Hyaloscypha variabilis F]
MKLPWRANQAHSSSDAQNADIVIAVIGMTGAGKSSFIASVTGREDIQVGHDLYSETSEVRPYRFSHKSTSYVLVDTPGFDDSTMSNEEVTAKILQWLESSYRNGTRLNGIIYIHDITKLRMQGSAYKNMRLLGKLCGDSALGNVILATSFWDQVSLSVGEAREDQLKNSKDFWANMVAKGSQVVRLKQDRAFCLQLLERIAAKNKVELVVQKEKGKSTMPSEIQQFEETLEKEKQAEKKNVEEKLKEGDRAHKQEMKDLRAEQKNAQREEKQRQREAEKVHKRNMREDRRQMRQDRRGVLGPIRRMEAEQRWCRNLYLLTAFWLLLATSLTGNLLADGNPVSINYAMFSMAWGWIAVFIGLASCFLSCVSLFVVLFWDIFAVIFTFCAAAEFAGRLGVHSCFNDVRLCAQILCILLL